MVPRKWYPQDQLDPDSFAFVAQFSNQPGNASPSKIGADAWFDRYDAERFEVMEQCFKTAPDETLTLITIINERMLEDEESARRRW
jgi:hypothetical protein